MGHQLKIAEVTTPTPKGELLAFDRAVLMHHTMDDPGLAIEVLALFEAQLLRLERLDWAQCDLRFEMHTLKGAASAVGALQLEALAEQWEAYGPHLKLAFTLAVETFRAAAT